MKYNNEFLNINNEKKAYTLGLFYSDGNISNFNSRIFLNNEDKKVFLNIKREFSFFNIYNKEDRQLGINSGNRTLYKHLKQNGLIERKSFENKELLLFPNINENLYSHFIRGYFDGDGGCTLTIKRGYKTQKRIYIYSVNTTLLKSMQDILKNNNIKNTISLSNKITQVFKLSISTQSYFDFYNYLYSDAVLFIDRKKELFGKILDTNFFVAAVTPKCKKCGNSKTVKHGFYKYKEKNKQIYLCRNCNKTFM